MTKGKNIVVFDIETKFAFDDVGGRQNYAKLGISVLGSFDYSIGEFVIYEENELGKFEERLRKRPLLVGFNSKKFDSVILQKSISVDFKNIPQLDIMEELEKRLGHRVSLDSVAQATLGTGKSGNGLEAIRLYREGRIEELKKYCLDDVRITRDIFEYGARHGEVFYTSKYGSAKARSPVEWKMENPNGDCVEDAQCSLF